MNFNDNSKNENLKNQKVNFSFVSIHSSSFMKTGSKLKKGGGGQGGLHILSWDRASHMKTVNTLTVYSNIIHIYKFSYLLSERR